MKKRTLFNLIAEKFDGDKYKAAASIKDNKPVSKKMVNQWFYENKRNQVLELADGRFIIIDKNARILEP